MDDTIDIENVYSIVTLSMSQQYDRLKEFLQVHESQFASLISYFTDRYPYA
jgi:hypothetical protein